MGSPESRCESCPELAALEAVERSRLGESCSGLGSLWTWLTSLPLRDGFGVGQILSNGQTYGKQSGSRTLQESGEFGGLLPGNLVEAGLRIPLVSVIGLRRVGQQSFGFLE